jgi:hypothetical protein
MKGIIENADHLRFDITGVQGNLDPPLVFRSLQAAFELAVERRPESVHESFYVFAGHSARLRIVGRNLAEHIVRPFSHLRVDEPSGEAPKLTIDLWDETETKIRCQTRSNENELRWSQLTVESVDRRFMAQRLPNTLTCLDRRDERIVGSMAWSDRIFIYERAKPFSRLLLEWHNDRNIQIIHAGLVASSDGQGVLFGGKSGSGKSTTALACLCGGLSFLSEDYVGLERLPDGSFVGHSVYNSVFLETNHLTLFRSLAPHLIRGMPHEEKSTVVLSHVFPERLVRAVPIRAIALPRVVETPDTKLQPASKGEALLALGPSSLRQIPSTGARAFEIVAQLVEQLPCYWLEINHELTEIPKRVEQLLEQVTQ